MLGLYSCRTCSRHPSELRWFGVKVATLTKQLARRVVKGAFSARFSRAAMSLVFVCFMFHGEEVILLVVRG